ncbi:hypothetical protein HDU76_002001 [Blyttiomyces sp. JEL0837]|nr:hypothetical protein HDU76_002001 [Blyttiomyces sp. JEL0837]
MGYAAVETMNDRFNDLCALLYQAADERECFDADKPSQLMIQDMIVSELMTLQQSMQQQADRLLAQTLDDAEMEEEDYEIVDRLDVNVPELPDLAAIYRNTNSAITSGTNKSKGKERSNIPYPPYVFEQREEDVAAYFDDMEVSGKLANPTLSCGICYEVITFYSTGRSADKLGTRFPGCSHIYCMSCLKRWILNAIQTRLQRFPLVCPHAECKSALKPTPLVKQWLDNKDADYQRFNELYLEATADTMYCPKKSCAKQIVFQATDPIAVSCKNCQTWVCRLCKVQYHNGLSCQSYQALPDSEKSREDLILHQLADEKKWRRCPSCRAVVERKEGCNYILCLCGVGFCYRCGVRYLSTVATGQHQHGTPGCQCPLFDVPAEFDDPPAPAGAWVPELAPIRPAPAPALVPVPVPMPIPLAAPLAPEDVNDDVYYPHYDDLPQPPKVPVFPPNNRDELGLLIGVDGVSRIRLHNDRNYPTWLRQSYRKSTCHYCNRQFNSFEELQQHMLTTQQHDVILCCERTFKTQADLWQHMRARHQYEWENAGVLDGWKLFERVLYFDHPWDTLTIANWRKYPNDLSSHVLSVDILSREVDPVTGILRTERLLCCKQSAPSFLKALGLPIPEVAYFREISELDPVTKQYKAESFNLSMTSIMSVKETCIFRELPADSPEVVKDNAASGGSPQTKTHSLSESLSGLQMDDSGSISSVSSATSSTSTGSKPSATTSETTTSTSSSSWAPWLWGSSSQPSSTTNLATSNTVTSSPPSPTSSTTAIPTFTSPLVTQFIQKAEFNACGFASIARMIEDAAVSRFMANAHKGRMALELVLEKVLEEAKGVEAKTKEVVDGLRVNLEPVDFAANTAAAAAAADW